MWQPIETAPKDGTVIDLFHEVAGRMVDTWWDDEDKCWVCIGDDAGFIAWMPTPEPPNF